MEEERARIRDYRDLTVWQKSMDLVIECYRLSDAFPRAEQFCLTSQLRRSAASVPSNVAEGHGRGTIGEYTHSLTIARGSLMEVETQVQIAARLGYLKTNQVESVLDLTGEVGRMLNALVSRLRSRVRPSGP